jgi:hypothetical protein
VHDSVTGGRVMALAAAPLPFVAEWRTLRRALATTLAAAARLRPICALPRAFRNYFDNLSPSHRYRTFCIKLPTFSSTTYSNLITMLLFCPIPTTAIRPFTRGPSAGTLTFSRLAPRLLVPIFAIKHLRVPHIIVHTMMFVSYFSDHSFRRFLASK